MPTSVNQVIRDTIQTMKERGLILTPDNYSEVFCEIAKKNGVNIPDCKKLENYIAKLNDDLKEQLKQKKVRNVDELFMFMASRLNSPNLLDHSKIITSLMLMIKRVFQSITVLHNKDAKKLAEASIEALNRRADTTTIDKIKDRWLEFLTDYDDAFLKRLGCYGVQNFDDLQTMIIEIDNIMMREPDGAHVCQKLVPLVITMLAPSITDKINKDIQKMEVNLKKEPTLLENSQTRLSIEDLVQKRIELDKAEILSKVSTLDKVLDGINAQIISLINSSSKSSDQMQFIKDDLSSINLSEDNFEGIRDKLISIAEALDGEVRQLGEQMSVDQKTIKELQERVSRLEVELESAKAENKEDFLTKTATKRALTEELERLEYEYSKFGFDYSVCFFDIDHFKRINDNYGHEAGDVVLAAVGKMLRKYSRQADFVGRYGGEEFVILLPQITLIDGVKFADKIRKIVQESKFLYKGERIGVTASCGVAMRSLNSGSTATVEEADKMLYAAKQGGRNMVMPKDL